MIQNSKKFRIFNRNELFLADVELFTEVFVIDQSNKHGKNEIEFDKEQNVEKQNQD